MTTINNKHVLITGAASGLGRLLALRCAGLGATVTIWDLDAAGGEAVAAEATAIRSTAPKMLRQPGEPMRRCTRTPMITTWTAEESTVASAMPACFIGHMRISISATFSKVQAMPIFIGVFMSCWA